MKKNCERSSCITPLCDQDDSTIKIFSNKSRCSISNISSVSTSNEKSTIRTILLAALSLTPLKPGSVLQSGCFSTGFRRQVTLGFENGSAAATSLNNEIKTAGSDKLVPVINLSWTEMFGILVLTRIYRIHKQAKKTKDLVCKSSFH